MASLMFHRRGKSMDRIGNDWQTVRKSAFMKELGPCLLRRGRKPAKVKAGSEIVGLLDKNLLGIVVSGMVTAKGRRKP